MQSNVDQGNCPNYDYGDQRTSPGGSHYWILIVPDSFKPQVGMIFDSIQHAFTFYEDYAMKGCFGVKRFSDKKLSRNMGVKLKYFTCKREGFKKAKKVDTIGSLVDNAHEPGGGVSLAGLVPNVSSIPGVGSNDDKQRETVTHRCGCFARVAIEIISGGKYRLYKFIEEHNHGLVHPDLRRHMLCARKLDFSQKLKLHQLSQASIGPVVGHRILAKMSGGFEELGATSVDCKNFKRDVIAYIGDSDCQMVVNMLSQNMDMLPDFSFEYFTCDGGRLGGLFWADDESKRNYFAFGDVVSFDATYGTNKYGMVFIPFTGVDNHGRCVTFGAGLLSKEDVFSYRWLLSALKKAFPMEPMMVVTDQDPALKIAIQEVFESARHRLCMWHITEKVSSKVGVAAINDGFKAELSKIVWTDKLSPHEFDSRWFKLISNFGLEENRWLSDMFSIRSYWVPAYFRLWPMSRLMRTSSRSESQNHMFGQLMNCDATLVEFFSHFDSAMQAQRFKQSKNDYDSLYSSPEIVTDAGFEKDASSFYTKSVFSDVKKEICHAFFKGMSIAVGEEDGRRMLVVVDTAVVSTRIDETIDRVVQPNFFDAHYPYESKVFFNLTDEEFECSCRYFDRMGLLCRHIFYVMRVLKFDHIPRRYISKRWTKNAVPPRSYQNVAARSSLGSSNSEDVADILRQIYYNVELSLSRLLKNKEGLEAYLMDQKRLLSNLDVEFGSVGTASKHDLIETLVGVSQPEQVSVLPPVGIRNKGWRKRFISPREQAIIDQNKPLRKCHYCKMTGHDSRTCEIRKEHAREKMKKKATEVSGGFGQSSSRFDPGQSSSRFDPGEASRR